MSPSQRRRSPHEAGNEVCLGGQLQSITDTTASAQRHRLLQRLQHEAIDTITARRELNIMMPAARVKELREDGYNIQTMQVERCDEQGRKHRRVAIYTLMPGRRV